MNILSIFPKKTKRLTAIAGLALLIITLAIPVFQASAQQHRLVKPEWVMPEGYPEWFHGWGRIGYIGDDKIVINDFEFTLSPRVDYHTPTSPSYAYKDLFVPGVLAGFLFNSQNEIISLWMITMEQ